MECRGFAAAVARAQRRPGGRGLQRRSSWRTSRLATVRVAVRTAGVGRLALNVAFMFLHQQKRNSALRRKKSIKARNVRLCDVTSNNHAFPAWEYYVISTELTCRKTLPREPLAVLSFRPSRTPRTRKYTKAAAVASMDGRDEFVLVFCIGTHLRPDGSPRCVQPQVYPRTLERVSRIFRSRFTVILAHLDAAFQDLRRGKWYSCHEKATISKLLGAYHAYRAYHA